MPWFVGPMKDVEPAIVVGELAKSFDPAVSEWGNPLCSSASYPQFIEEGKRGN